MILSRHKIWARTLWLLITLKAATTQTYAGQGSCRPVMLLHGLFESALFMQSIEDRIKKDYPGTDTYNSDAYSYLQSTTALYDQINGQVGQEFLAFNAKHPDGITLIGHSQGALLFRSLCEIYSNHSVHTYIGIAGPQRGGYGTATLNTQINALIQVPPFLEAQTDYYYTPEAQRTLSFTNYWNDPLRHEEYLKKNIFLPVLNNEVQSNESESFKQGFTKLKRQVTIGGPDDGTIIPWQSSEYSYFGDQYPAVVDYRDSIVYQQDTFGLRTLDESGRWIRYRKSGLNHIEFLYSEEVYKEAILPYLDCTSRAETTEENKQPEATKKPEYEKPEATKKPEY